MTPESNQSQEQNSPFSMDDFAKALDEHDYNFTKGQVIKGKVCEHTSDGAYVDIGGKSPGFVPLREAALQSGQSLTEALPLQSEQEFLIISNENDEGQFTLSYRRLLLKQAWERLAEIAESGDSVQMRVTGTNRGGVTGEVEGLRGFIPRSHLMEKENLDSLIGQLLTATIIEVAPENNKLVLSQRAIMRAAAISKIREGVLMAGKVASIKPYGIFVDLSGITGLLHISQVSSKPIDSLEAIFNIGQEIKVIIIEVDEVKNRIALSMKVLESFSGEVLTNLEDVLANAEARAESINSQQ